MATPNDVELLIRARNQASKTLDQVEKQLLDVADAQKALASSTELAGKSQKDLKLQAEQLLGTLGTLKKTLTDVEAYKKARQASVDLNTQLDRQKKALRDITAEIVAAEKPSAELKLQFKETAAAIRATQVSITNTGNSIAKFSSKLEAAGVSIADLNKEESRLDNLVRETASAFDTQTAAIGRYENAVKEVAETERRRAEETKALQAEVAKRQQAELARVQAQQSRYKQIADERIAREQRLAQAVETFQKQRTSFEIAEEKAVLDAIERRRRAEEAAATELQRRNSLISEARLNQLNREIARQEALNKARIEQKREDSITAFQAGGPVFSRADPQVITNLEQIARAQRNRAEADLRVLDINRRADAVEARLAERRKALGLATDKLTATQERGAAAQQRFNDSTRTSLSLYQRLRGQVLSLTGAYVGLFGAITTLSKSLEVAQQRDTAISRFALSEGSLDAAGREYAYVAEQAERLGLSLNDVSNSYSKFAFAAKNAGFTTAQTRFVFEGIAEASRVLGLSVDETQGTFVALQQIVTKGKISAEELNQQLGDRLPGAIQVLARVVERDIGIKLNDALKKGLDSKTLIAFAEEYKRTVGKQLPSATQAFAAQVNRSRNDLNKFLLTVADSGFRDALTGLLGDLREFFNSPDGQDFARNLGAALGATVEVVRVLVRNFDSLLKVFVALVAINRAKPFAEGIAALLTTATAAKAATVQLTAAQRAANLLSAALRGIFLAFAAYNFAKLAFEEFSGVQKTLLATVYAFKQLGAAAKFVFTSVIEAGKSFVAAFGMLLFTTFGTNLRLAVKAAQTAAAAIGNAFNSQTLKDAAESLGAFDKTLESVANGLKSTVGGTAGRLGAALDTYKRELKENKEEFFRVLDEVDKEFAARANRKESGGGPGGTDPGEIPAASLLNSDGDAEKAAKRLEALADKRVSLEEEVARKISEIREANMKDEEQTLAQQLAIVNSDYDQRIAAIETLQRKLRELAADYAKVGQAQAASTLNEKASQLDEEKKLVESSRPRALALAQENYLREQLKLIEQQINDKLAERTALIDEVQARVAVGNETELQGRQQIYDIQEQTRQGLEDSYEAAIALSQALGDSAGTAAFRAKLTLLKQVNTEVQTLTNQLNEELAGGLTRTFLTLGRGIAGVIKGTNSMSDAFKSAGDVFRNFAADFLEQIAQMIIQALILRAIKAAMGMGGPIGAFAGFIGGASGTANHTGGMAGSGHRRSVSPAWFTNAARYHNGGVVGLKPNEVPAILERGEEVLPDSDPRHAANGGAAPGSNIKIVNAIDSGSVVSEGLNTSSGQKAILNFIRANRASVRNVLGAT